MYAPPTPPALFLSLVCPSNLPENAVALDDVLHHLVLPQVSVQPVAVELVIRLNVHQQPLLLLLRRLQRTSWKCKKKKKMFSRVLL